MKTYILVFKTLNTKRVEASNTSSLMLKLIDEYNIEEIDAITSITEI